MRKFKKTLFYITIMACISFKAFSLQLPQGLVTDNRIKVVSFQPNQVVAVHGDTFITTQIIFGQNEQIVDVEGGDAAAWTMSIDKQLPNVLNLKPTVLSSNSNLLVTTVDNQDKRRYYRFDLTSNNVPNSLVAKQTYAIQFIYPEEEKAAILAKLNLKKVQNKSILNAFKDPSDYNWNYSFNGDRSIMPLHVFDDGKFTYMQLRPNQIVPSVFAVNNTAGKESVVNYRRTGNYLIIEEISPQFTLRAGRYAVASIFNNRLITQLRSN